MTESLRQTAVDLPRVVGVWDLTWQAVNIVVGASIFVLPGVFLGAMGPWAAVAVMLAYVGVLPIVLVFAEAAGRYRAPGGMYRYVGDAFGEYAGTQVGFLYWLVRITASAAVANVFVTYLAELWPAATQPVARVLVLTLLLLSAAWMNVRGTRQAASTLNFLALAKLLPLLLLCAGAAFVVSMPTELPSLPQPTVWARAILLWVFALGGFEATLIPASEATNPERDGPRALLIAMAIVAGTYASIQLVVVLLLGHTAADRPVAQAAQIVAGRAGALLVTGGALVATVGHIGASMLAGSRITFAMASRGALPAAFQHVHPVFRTPSLSIVVFASGVWLLAVSGSFVWNAYLSAVARLFVYAATAFAVLRLRRNGSSTFVVPTVVPYIAIGFCLWLLANQTLREALAVGVVVACGSVLWLLRPRIRS